MFFGLCCIALNFIANGRLIEAAPILATVGWRVDERLRGKLDEVLAFVSAPQAIEIKA